MLIPFFVLQAIGEGMISDSIASFGPPVGDEASNGFPTASVFTLGLLLVVNVVVIIVNFILETRVRKKDNHNHKVRLIAKTGVEVEADVFKRFQTMASYQPGDEHKLLDEILSMDSYCNTNRLYIEKRFLACATDFLDYFKRIQHKMTRKDIKKEESYFIKLSKAFYGE